MKFTLNIKTSNAALTDESAERELARILRSAAEDVENGVTYATLIDSNGASVGTFNYKPERVSS